MPTTTDTLRTTIEIRDWQSYTKDSLRAFFTAVLPSGMILHKCTYFIKGKERWVGMPSQQYKDEKGNKGYRKLIEFVDRAAGDRFQKLILPAVDEFLHRNPQLDKLTHTDTPNTGTGKSDGEPF